jgi:YfiH family protein
VLRSREEHGPAGVAFTGRAGGASAAPYGSLNLGDHVGDDPAAVRDNRQRVAEAVGADVLVVARQVHGTRVVEVTGPWDGDPPEADALVTRTAGIALGVLVADCTPVVLLAPDEGVVAVAHAGREGLRQGVVAAVLAAVRDLGGRRLVARVGPSVSPRCYPVPLELREQVAADVPEARSVDRHGRPSLDVAGGVLAQLAPHCADLAQLPGCTSQDPDLFSYRRDGTTGRSAGVAWLRR